MTRRWRRERAKLFKDPNAAEGDASTTSARLVGVDFAPVPTRARRRTRVMVPIVLGFVLSGLLLASLRVEIIYLRYALADAAGQEEELLERQRLMTVRVRELRDPGRLRTLAEESGFVRPRRVLTLEMGAPAPEPTAPGLEPSGRDLELAGRDLGLASHGGAKP
jgi:hypothetical protein